MDRYRFIRVIGDGTFGTVLQAEHIETGRIVAVKKMKKKFDTWEECLRLREIKALKQLSHPHIVRLHEVVREHRELHFIFEHLQQNLYQAVRHRRITRLSEVRDILKQSLLALEYMHLAGFVHRDVKPENILLTQLERKPGSSGNRWLVKVADLGLARKVLNSPDGPPLTQYVSTRWYRAPEVLLRCRDYTYPVDVWALGTVAAELCTGRPLFPGRSEPDQLVRLCAVLGTPDAIDAPGGLWLKGVAMARSLGLRFPKIVPLSLIRTLMGLDITLLNLITRILRWDPLERPTCTQSLDHPFFHSTLDRSLLVTPPSTSSSMTNSMANVYQSSVPVAAPSETNITELKNVSLTNATIEATKQLAMMGPQHRAHRSLPHIPNGAFESTVAVAGDGPTGGGADGFPNANSIEESLMTNNTPMMVSPNANSSSLLPKVNELAENAENELEVETLEDGTMQPETMPQLELSFGDATPNEETSAPKTVKKVTSTSSTKPTPSVTVKKPIKKPEKAEKPAVRATLGTLIGRAKRSKTIDARQREPERAQSSRRDFSRLFSRSGRGKTPKQITGEELANSEATDGITPSSKANNVTPAAEGNSLIVTENGEETRGRQPSATFSLPRLFQRSTSVAVGGEKQKEVRDRGRSQSRSAKAKSELPNVSVARDGAEQAGISKTSGKKSNKSLDLPRLNNDKAAASASNENSSTKKTSRISKMPSQPAASTSAPSSSAAIADKKPVKRTSVAPKKKVEPEAPSSAASSATSPPAPTSAAVASTPSSSSSAAAVAAPGAKPRGRASNRADKSASVVLKPEEVEDDAGKKRARSTGADVGRTIKSLALRLRTPKDNPVVEEAQAEEETAPEEAPPALEKKKSQVGMSSIKNAWKSVTNVQGRSSADLVRPEPEPEETVKLKPKRRSLAVFSYGGKSSETVGDNSSVDDKTLNESSSRAEPPSLLRQPSVTSRNSAEILEERPPPPPPPPAKAATTTAATTSESKKGQQTLNGGIKRALGKMFSRNNVERTTGVRPAAKSVKKSDAS